MYQIPEAVGLTPVQYMSTLNAAIQGFCAIERYSIEEIVAYAFAITDTVNAHMKERSHERIR